MLVSVLAERRIPPIHRWGVSIQDVMQYKANIDRLGGALRVRARNETLNELVAQAQELDMGYEQPFDNSANIRIQ
jgi:hypothetical protein